MTVYEFAIRPCPKPGVEGATATFLAQFAAHAAGHDACKPRRLRGDRPASICIPMLSGRGLTRSILLYMIQNPRSGRIAEWLLRVLIADLRGSRRERPSRAESCRSLAAPHAALAKHLQTQLQLRLRYFCLVYHQDRAPSFRLSTRSAEKLEASGVREADEPLLPPRN